MQQPVPLRPPSSVCAWAFPSRSFWPGSSRPFRRAVADALRADLAGHSIIAVFDEIAERGDLALEAVRGEAAHHRRHDLAALAFALAAHLRAQPAMADIAVLDLALVGLGLREQLRR